MLKLKKYNRVIIASVCVGGRARNHFRKKRDFIWIVMNLCGQEWASGRLKTQIWNAVGNLWNIFISHLCPFLCIQLIVHSFCWLAASASQESHQRKANHSFTEGPNLCSLFSVSLASNPNNRIKIPICPSHPINREWSQSVGSHFIKQQPASCPWGSLGQYKLGRCSGRSPLREADFHYCRRSCQQHQVLGLGRTVGRAPGDKSPRLDLGEWLALKTNRIAQIWPCRLTARAAQGLALTPSFWERLQDRGPLPKDISRVAGRQSWWIREEDLLERLISL